MKTALALASGGRARLPTRARIRRAHALLRRVRPRGARQWARAAETLDQLGEADLDTPERPLSEFADEIEPILGARRASRLPIPQACS